MWKKIIIAGCLVWLPIIATIWVIQFLVTLFDKLINFLPHNYRPDHLLGFHIPGLGILLAVVVVLITGLLVTNFLGNKIVIWTDSFMKRVPFIGSVYSTVKQVLETIVSTEGRSFRKVLLIEYPRKGLWTVAFQTSEASQDINEAAKSSLVMAFIPTTPNPTSGFLIAVPKEDVIELDMSTEDAFKLIVSLGTIRQSDSNPDTLTE